jgi:hypothetical protein
MRSAATRTLSESELRPAQDSIYAIGMADIGGAMLKALRAWEERRGLTFNFGKYKCFAKKIAVEQKNTKVQADNSRSVKVPRNMPKTEAQKRQAKNEANRRYRLRKKQKAKGACTA